MAVALNYSLMEEQWGDEERGKFSYTDVELAKINAAAGSLIPIPKYTKP
jgi:hypothetical protein